MRKFPCVYTEISLRIYRGFHPHTERIFPKAKGAPLRLPSSDKATGMLSLGKRFGTTSAYTARCSANDSIFAL